MAAEPRLSVWPSTWILRSGYFSSASPASRSEVSDSGLSVALPVSKYTFSRRRWPFSISSRSAALFCGGGGVGAGAGGGGGGGGVGAGAGSCFGGGGAGVGSMFEHTSPQPARLTANARTGMASNHGRRMDRFLRNSGQILRPRLGVGASAHAPAS